MSAESEVLEAAAKIVDDFGHHRTSEYFGGFSADATFIFYTHDERLNSRAEYEELWKEWESEAGFKVHSCVSTSQKVQLIAASAAVFTHLVTSEIEFEGQISKIHERETIVFAKLDSNWVAIHEHLSPETSPEPVQEPDAYPSI